MGLDVPDRGLSAGHVAVDRRHHRRAGWPHRPVAGPAAHPRRHRVGPPPAPAHTAARHLAAARPRARARTRAGLTVAYLLVLVVLAGVVWLITGPLREARRR